MPWGLDGIQLSNRVQAIKIEESTGFINFVNGIGKYLGWDLNQMYTNVIQGMQNAKHYDFYLSRDAWNLETSKGEKPEDYRRDYQGRIFNEEIIGTLLAKHTENEKVRLNGVYITESDLKSAIAYVYNKNKRDASGQVCIRNADGTMNTNNLKWYLPAIDEIEEIAIGAYDEFDKVFQNQKYWSCQPSFDKNRLSMDVMVSRWNPGDVLADFYSDDLDRARATSIYTIDGVNYQNISSGVPGYAGTQYGTIDWTTPSFGDYVPTTLDFKDHTGNLERTQKCR